MHTRTDMRASTVHAHLFFHAGHAKGVLGKHVQDSDEDEEYTPSKKQKSQPKNPHNALSDLEGGGKEGSPVCKWGKECYNNDEGARTRTQAHAHSHKHAYKHDRYALTLASDHLHEYTHPQEVCKYGAECYQKNVLHKKWFSHPDKQGAGTHT